MHKDTDRKRIKRTKLRIAFLDLLGGRCAICSESDYSKLQFDHIDPKQKSFEITDKLDRYALDKLKAEVAKCQILCSNCHITKSALEKRVSVIAAVIFTRDSFPRYNKGGSPCPSLTAYGKGCRCSPCVENRRNYQRHRGLSISARSRTT